MFFLVSKLFWMLASPINILVFAALAGAILAFTRFARFGRVLALVAILALAAVTMLPVGALILAPLEERFPGPPADMPAPYGIVVLGGALDDDMTTLRGQTTFNEGGERLTEAVILAKRYPQAKIVYTSGTNSILGGSSTEAAHAREFMAAMGVDPDRITIEDKARNTEENAVFTAEIVHPQPSQKWVVVTSAFHMPRSMGLFEKAGFNAVAFPVAYVTAERGFDPNLLLQPNRNLRAFSLAAHEWIGLLAYWASGRIASLFPAPG